MFTGQEYKELQWENVHVIPQNSFVKAHSTALVCIFKKGERKLNIFLVLRIKGLSVYPEMHCIVVGASVHCLSARGMKE